MSLNQWLLKFKRTIVALLSGLCSPAGHSSQHKSTNPSKCQQTSPNNIVSHSRRLKSCVCVIGGVEWCPLVWSGANCYRLTCLSTAVSLQKEITVPNEEVQRWYGWLGEQQSLLPLLWTEPQIIQPVASLHTNKFPSARDHLLYSIMPYNITINELLFTVFVL